MYLIKIGSYIANVSIEDYERLDCYKWHPHVLKNKVYAMTRIPVLWDSPKKVYMHQLILPNKYGFEVDHIDGNGLNNTRSNLRYATKAQNAQNRSVTGNGASKYKGVSKSGYRWRATIRVNGEFKHIGVFDTQIKAAKAYDSQAKKYFGEFANLNFKENECT